jgi:glutaminyl-peptide cyclotransferase
MKLGCAASVAGRHEKISTLFWSTSLSNHGRFMSRLRVGAMAVLLATPLVACDADSGAAWQDGPGLCQATSEQTRLDYDIVRVLPHDPAAYTQGLLIDGDDLFESTGLYGNSSLRRLERATGRELDRVALPKRLFGEGLALAHGRLYQLSWQEGEVRVYQPRGLHLLQTLRIPGEGWGLTYDGKHLIQSDGSATLFFRAVEDLAEVRRVEVRAGQRRVSGLNELEYAQGYVFANIYPSDCIAVIDPGAGRVVAWLDMHQLAEGVRERWPAAEVTNGIAYDPRSETYYLTGKHWPELFELRLIGLGER